MAMQPDADSQKLHAELNFDEHKEDLLRQARRYARENPHKYMAGLVLDRSSSEGRALIKDMEAATGETHTKDVVVALCSREELERVMGLNHPQLVPRLLPPVRDDGLRLLPVLVATKNGAMMVTVGYEAAGWEEGE